MQHHDICFYVVGHVFNQRPQRHIAVPVYMGGVPDGFIDKVVDSSLDAGEQVIGKYRLSDEVKGEDVTIFFVAPSDEEE